LGNFTGVPTFEVATYTVSGKTYDGYTTHTTRYRGLEGIFGDIGLILEGIMIEGSASKSDYYVWDNIDECTDTIDSNAKLIASVANSAESGFVKTFLLGDKAEIIPT
jgi:hypothetical protein